MISILIPVYNNVHYTKLCIESIFATTQCPVEIIVVDNGSTDETKEVLQELEGRKPEYVKRFASIANKKNLGVVKAFNQGIRAYTGTHIVLQNNDCVMGGGWLEEMVEVSAELDAAIVAPCSNLFEGKKVEHPQLLPKEYQTIPEMLEFAKKLRSAQPRVKEADYVFGHCMMIRRDVFENIGVFDERFGIGYFEEIDLCKRAKDAGLKVAVARRAYVHHFGNKTLDLLGIDREKLLKENQALYEKKWGGFHDKL